MPRGAKIGHRKGGGRVKGTPNKRSLALRQALEAHGCFLEEQIAGLLKDPEVEKPLKVDLVAKLLPYLFPQLRPVDADNVLTPQQAAGMLGAQAIKFRAALTRYVSDPTLIARVFDDLRTDPSHSNGASAAAV
jgi:hypothetical protein